MTPHLGEGLLVCITDLPWDHMSLADDVIDHEFEAVPAIDIQPHPTVRGLANPRVGQAGAADSHPLDGGPQAIPDTASQGLIGHG